MRHTRTTIHRQRAFANNSGNDSNPPLLQLHHVPAMRKKNLGYPRIAYAMEPQVEVQLDVVVQAVEVVAVVGMLLALLKLKPPAVLAASAQSEL